MVTFTDYINHGLFFHMRNAQQKIHHAFVSKIQYQCTELATWLIAMPRSDQAKNKSTTKIVTIWSRSIHTYIISASPNNQCSSLSSCGWMDLYNFKVFFFSRTGCNHRWHTTVLTYWMTSYMRTSNSTCTSAWLHEGCIYNNNPPQPWPWTMGETARCIF